MGHTLDISSKVERLQLRHAIFRRIRAFFNDRDFLEIHTPLLVRNPGLEPHLVPFETCLEAGMECRQKDTLYLPTSPEYHLKKALSWGCPRIYEITRSFRNGEMARYHEPEFFMLEWYRHPGTYRDIARDFKSLLKQLGVEFASEDPWLTPRDLTVEEAFRRFTELDLEQALNGKGPSLTEQARRRGFESVQGDDDFDTAFHKILIEHIEPKLGWDGPLFLWDYPASLCALSRVSPKNPLYCERFEVYWKGVELGNAFGELTDPEEQRKRCEADRQTRIERYGKSPPLDEDLFHALGKLPGPAGGIAVGLDRLVQCLLGLSEIQQVIAFPHRNSV